MWRLRKSAVLLAVGMVLVLNHSSGQERRRRLEDDPVFGPILKARREGRLLDEKKLLESAIREAEAKSPPDPRLRPLLSQLADLDLHMGRRTDAHDIAKRVLDMDEQLYGAESPRLLKDLNNLGYMAGDNVEAGGAFECELAISRKNNGVGLLLALGDLSSYYRMAGRTKDAKPLLVEAVGICDQDPGPHFPDCSEFRNELAGIYRQEGDPSEAEALVARGAEQSVGIIQDSFTQVSDLNALAEQYEQDGSYALAEKTYLQAIDVIEKTKGLKNPDVGVDSERRLLAELFEKEGRNAEAEEIYLQNLKRAEMRCSPDHPEAARNLWATATPLVPLFREEGRLADMEPIFHQILAIQERDLGQGSARLVDTLRQLTYIYREEEKYANAAPLCARAIAIVEKNEGPESPRLLGFLSGYAEVLRKLGETDQAQSVEARASALQEKLRHQASSSRN